jgi:hypothetical protein
VSETTATVTERTCPPSALHDQILPWSDVREGDLIVWDGEFRLITCMFDYAGKPMMWFDGSKVGGVVPCGTYAAVRRYDTGED